MTAHVAPVNPVDSTKMESHGFLTAFDVNVGINGVVVHALASGSGIGVGKRLVREFPDSGIAKVADGSTDDFREVSGGYDINFQEVGIQDGEEYIIRLPADSPELLNLMTTMEWRLNGQEHGLPIMKPSVYFIPSSEAETQIEYCDINSNAYKLLFNLHSVGTDVIGSFLKNCGEFMDIGHASVSLQDACLLAGIQVGGEKSEHRLAWKTDIGDLFSELPEELSRICSQRRKEIEDELDIFNVDETDESLVNDLTKELMGDLHPVGFL